MTYVSLNTWTQERVERLKTLWAAGLSCSQIARQLGGVSRNAVIGKTNRLGLQGRGPAWKPPLSARSVVVAAVKRKPAPKPRPVVVIPFVSTRPLPPPPTGLVPLLDLQSWHCRFPFGDPGNDSFGFCGQHKADGDRSYCGKHRKRASRSDTKSMGVEG